MKILIVHNYYQHAGGEHTALRAQLELLEKEGHQVVLYTKHNNEIRQFDLKERLSALPNTIFSSSTYREIVQLVREEKPQIAHIHNVFPLISPSVYRALADTAVPMVQTIHNFRLLCPNGLFYTHGTVCERCKHGNTLHAVRYRCHRESYLSSTLYAASIAFHRYQETFQSIDRFIALTDFTAQKLVESGLVSKDRIVVLGNYLPEPLPQVSFVAQREPYVVFIGRLSAEKGVAQLIQAAQYLPGINLKILGEGPEQETLQRMVEALHLQQVEFLGFVTGDRKWELLRHATATIVPSVWYENFPFSVLESLAVGTPVVASNLGSLPYVLQDGVTGLLFTVGDPLDLADKIRALSTQPQLTKRMRQKARALIEQRYVASVHYERLMDIYQGVLDMESTDKA
ncbi:MAG: glycosyltransferase [Chloroflexota bacterium]|nr:glycosyltransferase [Chloroflexota bacterium]